MRELFDAGGLAVEVYDPYHRDLRGMPCEGDVEFYLRTAEETGDPVLELGCGTGRVLYPLARAGHRVTGLDASPHMLAVARSKLEPGLARRVTLAQGDLADFDLGRRFRLILIPFRAFQHLLTVDAQRGCLGCVRRHLARGGRFVVDLFDPRLDLCLPSPRQPRRPPETVRHPATGNRVSVECRDRRNDPLAQTLRETWIFTERDRRGRVVRRQRDRLTLRWTYQHEMRHLLELCGFRPVALYGDYRGGPPRYGAEQVWVAERA